MRTDHVGPSMRPAIIMSGSPIQRVRWKQVEAHQVRLADASTVSGSASIGLFRRRGPTGESKPSPCHRPKLDRRPRYR